MDVSPFRFSRAQWALLSSSLVGPAAVFALTSVLRPDLVRVASRAPVLLAAMAAFGIGTAGFALMAIAFALTNALAPRDRSDRLVLLAAAWALPLVFCTLPSCGLLLFGPILGAFVSA